MASFAAGRGTWTSSISLAASSWRRTTDQVRFRNAQGEIVFEAGGAARREQARASTTRSSTRFHFLRNRCQALPEADDPLAEPDSLSRRPRRDRQAFIPTSISSGATCRPFYADEVEQLDALGCTYLQLDDTSLAYLNDPDAAPQYIDALGGDAENQHLDLHPAHSIAALEEAGPSGVHLMDVRGTLMSSWVPWGGYDYVAEALFNELAVEGFFLEYDDGDRAGSSRSVLPKGKRSCSGSSRRKKASSRKGRAETSSRGSSRSTSRSTSSVSSAVRLLLDRRWERTDPRRGSREAPADGRDGRGDLGDVDAGRHQNGNGCWPLWTVIQRSSVNSSTTAWPPKRPQPESLTPPNGICGSSPTGWSLTWTIPVSSAARARSRGRRRVVMIPAARP